MNRMKIVAMASITAMTIAMTGCGSSSSSSSGSTPPVYVDPITEKDAIVIIHNYPKSICLSDTLYNRLQSANYDPTMIIRSEQNLISCQDYDRSDDGISCREDSAGAGDLACVVGFDIDMSRAGGSASGGSSVELKIDNIKDALVTEAG